ncbi:apolipoprotein N-acyltransferase [Hyphobacterium vulgare]|uniref:apolipoprotein N-acyltransferase n=1 Tax=Hyphobacterium vulgare TaxID=1736751 RepID=UPI0036D37867
MSALAHAPVFFFPALVAGLTALLWALDGAARARRPMRAGFITAFVFALGYFAAGIFWIAFAFFSRGPAFAPFGPLAALGLAAILALFWGLAGAAQARLGGRGPARILFFAVLLFAAEWGRGHVLTGFPWNLPAYVWPGGGAVSQSAALIGAWGLSFLTLLGFLTPSLLAGRPVRAGRYAPLLVAVIVFAGLFAWGAQRLAAAAPGEPTGVRLRIVQVDIGQREKWQDGNQAMVRDRYLEATGAPGLESVTHVLWPEGALPLYLLEDGDTLAPLSRLLADGPTLIAGTPRRDTEAPGGTRYYNAIAAVSFPGGRPRLDGLYDKVRLVPFGEYIPFAGVFRSFGIASLSTMVEGYSPGEGAANIQLDNAPPFAPLVCYEIAYPLFTARGARRPAWIANLSNDAWFGPTAGPVQHLNIAQYRAIEEGLPIARTASGGWSGVIDALGRTNRLVRPGVEGAFDFDLPPARPPTLYSVTGNAAAFLFWACALAGFVVVRRRSIAKLLRRRS